MTNTSEHGARHTAAKERHRPNRGGLSKGLFTTLPIVLVGSMAISAGLTGPIQTTESKPRADKPRSTPSELGKSIREAFTAAARAATNTAQVSAAETAVAATAPATYRVTAGDTVSSIAGRYGLATASVLALNGLGWKSTIFPGQVLKLSSSGPVAIVATPTVSASSRYTIQKGDTIGHIAAKFGVTTQNLLSANGLGWSSIIYPGQTLAIPGASVASAGPATPLAMTPVVSVTPSVAKTYVIAIGDTISSIATRFGVTTQALLAANGLGWSSIIYTGRSLIIPGAGTTTTASTPQSTTLTAEMAANARTIITVGQSLGVPDYGLVIALAAAAQESGLRNLTYGDRDSIGLFQQRPSTGWGQAAQILDTTYASRLFFGGPSNPNKGFTRGLLDIPGWQSKTVTQAAQAVQLSGYPDAYAKWEAPARSWLATLR
jgi:LysM repeat protein